MKSRENAGPAARRRSKRFILLAVAIIAAGGIVVFWLAGGCFVVPVNFIIARKTLGAVRLPITVHTVNPCSVEPG